MRERVGVIEHCSGNDHCCYDYYLVVVLAEIQETCVSGNAIGLSVGWKRRLTFYTVTWVHGGKGALQGKTLSLELLFSPGSPAYWPDFGLEDKALER